MTEEVDVEDRTGRNRAGSWWRSPPFAYGGAPFYDDATRDLEERARLARRARRVMLRL
jgi:hypothetical protein